MNAVCALLWFTRRDFVCWFVISSSHLLLLLMLLSGTINSVYALCVWITLEWLLERMNANSRVSFVFKIKEKKNDRSHTVAYCVRISLYRHIRTRDSPAHLSRRHFNGGSCIASTPIDAHFNECVMYYVLHPYEIASNHTDRFDIGRYDGHTHFECTQCESKNRHVLFCINMTDSTRINVYGECDSKYTLSMRRVHTYHIPTYYSSNIGTYINTYHSHCVYLYRNSKITLHTACGV